MSSFVIRFGPVRAEISADDALAHCIATLREWFTVETSSTAEEPSLKFALHATGSALPGAGYRRSAGGGGRDEQSVDWWDGRGWQARVARSEPGEPLQWDCYLREGRVIAAARRVPDAIVRLAHVHHFAHAEMLASAFVYGHLLPAVQVVLRQMDATFVHASSVCNTAGVGMLIAGWGGAGKTSASSHLYMRAGDHWRYMSDDLAILDRRGRLHRSPVPVNVFPYNTQRFPELADEVLGRRGAVDRFHWRARERLLGASGVARRLAPLTSTLGPESASIGLAIQLQRAAVEEVQVRPLSAGDLARSAKAVLAHELRRGLDGFAIANAFVGAGNPVLPSPDEVLASAGSLIEEALATPPCLCVDVPERWGPDDVGTLVERLAHDAGL